MATSVEITGVRDCQQALEIFNNKLFILATMFVDEMVKEGSRMAKRNCPVDSGSLQDSIEGGITEIVQGEHITGQVGAGKEDVVNPRGRATSKYAIPVEFGYGPYGKWKNTPHYMTRAYLELVNLSKRRASTILSSATKRI